jgi:hypothetical protein
MFCEGLADGVHVQWCACNHAGESLTRLWSCLPLYTCNPARVGTRIECGCPPLAFRLALSLSPEIGSGEADMGCLGQGGDSPEHVAYSRPSLGESEISKGPRGELGRDGVCGDGPRHGPRARRSL